MRMKIGMKREEGIFVNGYGWERNEETRYIYIVQNSKEFFIHISKRTKIFI